MLAQPQSTPAARILATPLSPPPATDHPIRFGSHPLAQPASDSASQPKSAQPGIRHPLAIPAVGLPDALRLADPSLAAEIQAAAAALAASGGGIAQAAGLAHDAGNLLGALGLYCDLLRVPGVLGPEHRHYATELGLIASRSSELIQRLLAAPHAHTQPQPARPWLDTSRDRATALDFQPSDVRRRDTAQREASQCMDRLPVLTHVSALRLLSPVLERIAAGCATVSICAPATLPSLNLSIETLERITVNLVRNAAEAIRMARGSVPINGLSTRAIGPAPRPTGTIRVALGVAGGRFRLTVEDDGPGMPPAVAAAFLQPGPLPPKPGRGLGHRIVHELVTASGGHISIRVRPGQGTAFCIRWPVPLSAGNDYDLASEGLGINHQAPAFPGGAPSELATTSGLPVQGEISTC
jgi:signal transduction histidine kinase